MDFCDNQFIAYSQHGGSDQQITDEGVKEGITQASGVSPTITVAPNRYRSIFSKKINSLKKGMLIKELESMLMEFFSVYLIPLSPV